MTREIDIGLPNHEYISASWKSWKQPNWQAGNRRKEVAGLMRTKMQQKFLSKKSEASLFQSFQLLYILGWKLYTTYKWLGFKYWSLRPSKRLEETSLTFPRKFLVAFVFSIKMCLTYFFHYFYLSFVHSLSIQVGCKIDTFFIPFLVVFGYRCWRKEHWFFLYMHWRLSAANWFDWRWNTLMAIFYTSESGSRDLEPLCILNGARDLKSCDGKKFPT